ncbi:MAG: VWA domain-containing protein, partial [Methanothrix sp.]
KKTLYFGVYVPPPAEITVVVFDDRNRNGIRDSGERGVPEWEVRISGPESYNASALTNAAGEVVRRLNEGQYRIIASPRPEWIFTTNPESSVFLRSGERHRVEIGVVGPQYIICYYDNNVNGQQDVSEPGLENWIFDIKDASGNLIASRSTDSRGRILISNLPAGRYTVTERISSSEWYNTTPSTLTADIPGHDLYFGNDMYRKLRIFKFNDSNNNKAFDANEDALSGWEFQVDGQANVTDGNGIAEFRVRANREYAVSESITSYQSRAGWQNSTPREIRVFIKPDDVLKEVQFGNHKIPTVPQPETVLRTIVYHDKDGDGSLDSGETPIPNVSLQITNLDLTFAPIARVVTDANGRADYICQGGRYSVELLLPDGWCSNMSIMKTADVKKGTTTTMEFGLVNCCDGCCNCEYRYRPEKTNMTFRVEDGNLIVRKSIDPWVLTPDDHDMCSGGLINYTITVSARPVMGQTDLVLAVDTSGSIIETDYSTLARIDEGIASFVENMQRSFSSGLRIGLVSWDSNIDESVMPTTRYTDVLNASHMLSANSQELTMYHVGMNESISALNADPRSDARKVIVFITDARNEYEPFITLPEPGVRVYVLLLGGVQMNDTYRMLSDVVGRYNGRIFMVNTSQDIVSALSSITSDCLLAEGSIRDIEIRDTLPSYLRPLDTGTVRGNLTKNMDGISWSTRTLSWRIPALKYGDSWSTTFRVVFCWKLQSNVVLSEKGIPVTSEIS